MTDPLDDRIRDGLTRLAAAVPVREADVNVAPVVATPVRTRALGRLLPAGASLLAAGVAVVVVASTFHIGPFTPGASPGAAPVVATVTDGSFELSLGATKAVYAANEPIDIDASLTFHGANPISIGHALGAPFHSADPRKSGPLNFGIEEPVLGTLVLAPGWRDACASTTLQPDVPLTSPFAKSAGFSGDDPRAEEYRAFAMDPVLRLAAGTWHVYAVAEFSIGDCGGEAHSIRADLEITVVDGPGATQATETGSVSEPASTAGTTPLPSRPQPSGDGGARGSTVESGFEVAIATDRKAYRTGDWIDPVLSLTNVEMDSAPPVSGRIPVLRLVIAEVGGGRGEAGQPASECAPYGSFEKDERHTMRFDESFLMTRGWSDDSRASFLDGNHLVLPPGTWTLRAEAALFLPDCDVTEPTLLQAEVTITVTP